MTEANKVGAKLHKGMPFVNSHSTASREPLKVLFMHGLESAPGGSKDKYLQQHFEEVYAPDMKVSLFRLTKSNSVLRNVLRRPLFLGWALAAATTLLIAVVTYGPLALPGWAAVFGAVLVANRKPLIRQALAASLDRCVAIQAAAICEFQPDVVVGSSWGGVVALMCASRGVHSCPMLLLAPPLKLLFDRVDKSGTRWGALCRSISPDVARRIVVVHGDRDATVPIDDSHSLTLATGAELRAIPGGDHQLNSTLIDSAQGESTSNRLRQLVVEVAARR